MRFTTVAKIFVCAFLVFFSASPALAGEAALFNGLNGEYWGLSEKEIAAKAPGEAAGRKTMASMVMLSFKSLANNIPVETGYTLKSDECWKMTINIESPDAATAPVVRGFYDEAVMEITEVLGEPTEKPAPDSPSQMISWDGETTSSLMYIDTNADGTARLSLSYESPALTEKIWGKIK